MAVAETTVAESCAAAKRAARQLATASTEAKNRALEATARLLEERGEEILEANAGDLADERAAGLTEALRDRLRLTPSGCRRWPMACGSSPPSTTRSARSWSGRRSRAASTCARCGCRWASWPSSTRRGRT